MGWGNVHADGDAAGESIEVWKFLTWTDLLLIGGIKLNYPVMLSICVPTYNQERYIRETLESVFMQKTQYSYEVLVGEDKSTDGTREVLMQIEKEHHPELKVFYREKNMNDSDYRNSLDLMDRAQGKYLIFLEGDDYWTDPLKIERQISFLERHPDYIATAHRCTVVDEHSHEIQEQYNSCKERKYTFSHYASEIMPGQTATFMMRNFKYLPNINTSLMRTKLMPGDRKMYFTMLCYGKIACSQRYMSAYRHITTSGGSWSARTKYNFDESKQWYTEQLEFAKTIGDERAIRIAEYMLFAAIRQGWLAYRSIGLFRFLREIIGVDHLIRCNYLMLKRDINRYLFKQAVFFPKKY